MSATMASMCSVARGRTSGVMTRKSAQVVEEGRLVARGQLADGDALGSRVADDLVVDVGDVHDPGHGVAAPGQVAAQEVGEEEAPEVADVGRRVDRRPAAVDADVGRVERLEGLERAAERVAEAQRHERTTWTMARAEMERPAPSGPSRLPDEACTATASVDVPSRPAMASRIASSRVGAEARPGAPDEQVDPDGTPARLRQVADHGRDDRARVDAARRRHRQPGTDGRGRRDRSRPGARRRWHAGRRHRPSGRTARARPRCGCRPGPGRRRGRRGGCPGPGRCAEARGARARTASARSRSAGVVILRLSASPSTTAIGTPSASSSAPSSVASRPSARDHRERCQEVGSATALGRLRGDQPAAIDGLDDPAIDRPA